MHPLPRPTPEEIWQRLGSVPEAGVLYWRQVSGVEDYGRVPTKPKGYAYALCVSQASTVQRTTRSTHTLPVLLTVLGSPYDTYCSLDESGGAGLCLLRELLDVVRSLSRSWSLPDAYLSSHCRIFPPRAPETPPPSPLRHTTLYPSSSLVVPVRPRTSPRVDPTWGRPVPVPNHTQADRRVEERFKQGSQEPSSPESLPW